MKPLTLALVVSFILVGASCSGPSATPVPPSPSATIPATWTSTPRVIPSSSAFAQPTARPLFTPVPGPPWDVCPNARPSHLRVGDLATVSLVPDLPNRVRASPLLDGAVVGQIGPGTVVTIIDGPSCSSAMVWWKVEAAESALIGWTSEGDLQHYWLVPSRAPGSGADSCVNPPNGLVSWWPADGNAYDAQGSNHGTLQAGATFTPGLVEGAFSFVGSGRMIAPSTDLPTDDSDRTLELWARVDAFNDGESFFAGYGNFGSFDQTYQLGAAGRTVYFSQWGQALFGPDLQTDRWYHVAVTSHGTLVTLYLDGEPVGTADLRIDTPSGTRFVVGSIPGDDSKRLNGLIDEVAVYNCALSATEIQAIYSAGPGGKCR
jgi:hypothetical protein